MTTKISQNEISSISSAHVTTALGYTPYNATNPSGYITGINSGNVTTALGYTPSSIDSPTFTGTPLAPTAAVTVNNTQIATTAFVRSIIPTGVILMWSGSVATIPSGWVLCNGANGTPDLRDRFIVGAGSTYAVAATGGAADAVVVSHSHTASSTVTDPGHSHTAPTYFYDSATPRNVFRASYAATQMDNAGTYGAYTGITVGTTITSTGVSATNANLPPYYALAFIMKT